MKTLPERISEDHITMTCTELFTVAPAGFPEGSTSWRVTLVYGKRRMTTPFHMGPAHTRPPEAAEVLSCLLSDASSWEQNNSVESFASDFGYDLSEYAERRRVQKIYGACRKAAEGLRRVLGDKYDAYLCETEGY